MRTILIIACVLWTSVTNAQLVSYDFDDCLAWIETDNFVYDEFQPTFPVAPGCVAVGASNIYRNEPTTNVHSCTPGVNGTTALCVSSHEGCTYDNSGNEALIFEVQINPATPITLTMLNFFQNAPPTFDWINGNSGINNYPLLYGVKVYVDDVEVFFQDGISTTQTWTEHTLDLNILIDVKSYITFEILPYCTVGNGSAVSAWDIDNLVLWSECDDTQSRPISGTISTKDDEPLNNVSINLTGPETNRISESDITGEYLFKSITMQQDFALRAEKNDEFLNGVSTLDLLLIEKHILGVKPFDTAEKIIAADANNSKSVSSIDLIELRKLILGIYEELPNNTSWIFADASQEISLDDPFNYSETINVTEVIDFYTDQNFNAIKIGDVNGSVETRSSEKITLAYDINDGVISFTAEDVDQLVGFQTAIKIENAQDIQLIAGAMNITEANYHLVGDVVKISWTGDVSAAADETLFSISVSANANAVNIDMVGDLASEAYKGDDARVVGLELAGSQANFDLVSVYPNPFSDVLSVDLNLNEASNVQIQLIDVTGKVLYDAISHLPKGTQTVNIVDDNLNQTQQTLMLKLTVGDKVINKRVVSIR